jgi:hypothetical protein
MTEPSARGSNGGKARKEKLSPERRKEIGKLAAAKRWAKPKETIEIGMMAQAGNATTLDPASGMMEPKTETIVLQAIPVSAPAAPPPRPPAPPITYTPSDPEPLKPPKNRRKPMVKEFGKAYSRAEKLLEEALKKRSEAVKIIIACNEDIPMYVNVIKSLGGTVDPQAMRAVDIRSLDVTSAAQNMNLYQPPQYQHPHTIPSQDVNPIDPALYLTNTNPLPGLAPAIANSPVVLNKPLGGAIDLGYTPVDEDAGPGLPNMGGGWA